MSSRYAAASHRSQLSSLLSASGFSGDVPSVTNTAEHNLLAWMAKSLRTEEHLMPEVEAAALSQQLMELPPKAKGHADVLLGHFSELLTNDLSALQDQGTEGTGALPSAWLEDETLEDLDDRLRELAKERCMYKKQMLELQALEAQLDGTQRASRSSQESMGQKLDSLKADVVSELAVISQVGTHINTQLHTLRGSLQEISALAQHQCQEWLISIKSRDKEGYLLQNCDMMSEMDRHMRQVDAHADGRPGRHTEQQGILLAPEDDPDWLASNDPYAPLKPSISRMREDLSVSELESMLEESKRVCAASKETERAFVTAKMDLAQHTAELETVQRLVREGMQLEASWTDEAQEQQLRDQIQKMKEEEDRLLDNEVAAVLKELQKAQSMHIMKGRYELQVQVQARRLQHRAVLIRALLEHSARHMLVHAVLGMERTELMALGTAVQDIDRLLSGISSASKARLALYAAAEQQTVMAGSDRGSRFLTLLDGLLQNRSPADAPAPLQHATPLAAAESVARRLATLHLQNQQALSKVSDTLFAGLKTASSQCQGAAQASRGLLFSAAAAPSSSHHDSEVAGIVLHPQEFEAKLLGLHSAAFKMNELLNGTVADNTRFHAHMSEHKEELAAERAVLEWFHLAPEKLVEHVTGVEQRVAAMGIQQQY